MRRLFLLMSGIILLFMSGSCSLQEDRAFVLPLRSRHLTFTAELGDYNQTKTAFQADETSIWWSPGDAIAIYYGSSEGSQFVSTNTEEVAQAEFQGELDAFTGVTETGAFNYFWAVYPYTASVSCDGQSVVAYLSDQQEAKAGSFAPNTNITIAKSAGLALSFYNTCSWFRFSVTKEGVKRVVFRGNDDEIVAGLFSVSMGDDGRPTQPIVIDGKKEISLSLPNHASFEVGKKYYITLLPQIFEKGFTVSFETADEIGSRAITAKATYLRSKYNSGIDFDKNVEYETNNQGGGQDNPEPPVNTTINVGDILIDDGIQIVAWTSEDYKYVLFMSVDELQKKDWAESKEWCLSHGTNWRMPTIAELTRIHENYEAINNTLSSYSLKVLSSKNKYWSCTVSSSNSNNYKCEYLYDGGIYENSDKGSLLNYCRAIKVYNSASTPYSVRPLALTMETGQTIRLSSVYIPGVTWTSSDNNVVNIDSWGNCQAIAEGSVDVTASGDGVVGQWHITVKQQSYIEDMIVTAGIDYVKYEAYLNSDHINDQWSYYLYYSPSLNTVDDLCSQGTKVDVTPSNVSNSKRRLSGNIIDLSLMTDYYAVLVAECGVVRVFSDVVSFKTKTPVIAEITGLYDEGIVVWISPDGDRAIILSTEQYNHNWSYSDSWARGLRDQYGGKWMLATSGVYESMVDNYAIINRALVNKKKPGLSKMYTGDYNKPGADKSKWGYWVEGLGVYGPNPSYYYIVFLCDSNLVVYGTAKGSVGSEQWSCMRLARGYKVVYKK